MIVGHDIDEESDDVEWNKIYLDITQYALDII